MLFSFPFFRVFFHNFSCDISWLFRVYYWPLNVIFTLNMALKSSWHHILIDIGIRDAQSPAYAKHSLSRIFVDSIKRSRPKDFLTTSFSKRLSHNGFLKASLSRRLSYNVFLTTFLFHIVPLKNSSTQRSPHNVTIYAESFYAEHISINISNSSKFRPPVIATNFVRSNWNLDVTRLVCNIYLSLC